MAKRKRKKFRVHAVMEISQDRRLELMFSSTLEKVTIRAVVEGVPLRPYSKSEIFYDERGAFITVLGEPSSNGMEMTYAKIYLESFKRVRG